MVAKGSAQTVRLSTGNWLTLAGMVMSVVVAIFASWYGLTQRVVVGETRLTHEEQTRATADAAVVEQVTAMSKQVGELASKIERQTETAAGAMGELNRVIGRLEGKIDALQNKQ